MSLNPRPSGPPQGDYIVIRGNGTDEQIADAERVLRENGCRSSRIEELDDGRVRVHGYLRSA